MSDNDRSVHPYLRRAADSPNPQRGPSSDFQRLMWTAIFYEKNYNKLEAAEALGVAADTVHAYANGDLRLHLDAAREFVQFVAEHNEKDRRFINYFLPKGYVALKLDKNGDTGKIIESLMDVIADLRKKVKAVEKSGHKYDEE